MGGVTVVAFIKHSLTTVVTIYIGPMKNPWEVRKREGKEAEIELRCFNSGFLVRIGIFIRPLLT